MITLDQVRRYTLIRQGLVERKTGDVTQFGPLHLTDHTTPYLSLLARLDPFDPAAVPAAFTRLRVMRGTLHLMPETIASEAACIYSVREGEPFPELVQLGISQEDVLELRFYITEALRLNGPQSTVTIKKFLEPHLLNQTAKGWQDSDVNLIGPVMRWMWALGLLESVKSGKTWRSKDTTFNLVDSPLGDCDRETALINLARRYVGWYGPVAYEDWRWWTGRPAGESKAAFEAIKDELAEVRVQGINETLWMLKVDLPELEATPDEPLEMARLLPYEDALIKGYKATRSRFYDEDGLAEHIAFTSGGEAVPTLWLDGRIVGVWSWIRKANEPMVLEPFVQITRDIRRRIKPEIGRVQRFIEASHVIWAD